MCFSVTRWDCMEEFRNFWAQPAKGEVLLLNFEKTVLLEDALKNMRDSRFETKISNLALFLLHPDFGSIRLILCFSIDFLDAD
jgi:hypothetical protein